MTYRRLQQSTPWPIPELPNISVDNFDESNQSSTCFFLSHCHRDHMNGLESKFYSFLKNNPGYYLYCSPFSRHILITDQDWAGADLSSENDFIKELEGKIVITIPGRDDSKTASYEVTVTAIPVDHCLGSVMYLFETPKTTVLYTGDFRIIKGDTPKFKELLAYCDGFNKIDKLYFDATFLNKNYQEFPEPFESLKHISKIIRNWLNADPNNHVNLIKSSTYGYEYAVIKLAEIFKCLIHVDGKFFKVYAEIPEIGSKLTTSPTETRIHCCPDDFIECNSSQLCKIKLSAKRFKSGPASSGCWVVPSSDGRSFDVCWATHCSLSEITDFLNHLKPKSLEPLSGTVETSPQDVKQLLHKIKSEWH